MNSTQTAFVDSGLGIAQILEAREVAFVDHDTGVLVGSHTERDTSGRGGKL